MKNVNAYERVSSCSFLVFDFILMIDLAVKKKSKKLGYAPPLLRITHAPEIFGPNCMPNQKDKNFAHEGTWVFKGSLCLARQRIKVTYECGLFKNLCRAKNTKNAAWKRLYEGIHSTLCPTSPWL